MSILGVAKTPKTVPVRAWFYGAPDAGKTHFAASFPNALILSTDGNYVYYPHVAANSMVNWEVGPLAKDEEKAVSFKNVLEVLKKSNPYDTIIVDLIEGIHRLTRMHYLKTLNVVHESDAGGWGKGYDVIKQQFISSIEQLFKLPVNIIVISHEEKEVVKPRNGVEYTVFRPALNEKLHQTVEGYCNLVSRIYMDTDEQGNSVRKLTLSPKEHEYGINRLGSADDLVLVHNGDVYGDFIKVFTELYDKRGIGLDAAQTNKTRETAEKLKAESAKEEALQKAKTAIAEEKAKKKEAEEARLAAEKEKETVVAEGEVDGTKEETPAEKVARLRAAKKIETVEEPAEVLNADDEPEFQKTDAVKEKLARLAQIKKERAAKAAEKGDK